MGTIRRRLGRATVTLSAAGHPLPLLRKADGTLFDAARPGSALGWFDEPDLSELRHELAPGDMLVVIHVTT